MHPVEQTREARDYAGLLSRLHLATDRQDAMQHVVDVLWEGLHTRGISWIGFYVKDADTDHLVLGPHRDKPACSPIGMHGVCGRCFTERRPVIVRDVDGLGGNYIACDPRDRSEVVLPLLEMDGACLGVLDVDSHDVAGFDKRDVDGLAATLEAAGLSSLPAALLHRTLCL